MWILPKQLHTSDFVPDTAALSLDSTELSEICARSLFVRSKPSPARTWSAKWRRDSWTQHLSGRILSPSHGQSFVAAWTSSLGAIPASHSAQPVNDSAQTTLATSGHLSQTEFGFSDLDSASLRMSKDTSPLDSERSLESWNKLVTKRRGEYSVRVKLAQSTRGKECLSWPTIRASEYKDTGPIGSKSHDHMLGKGYLCAVVTQDAANWPTPCAMEAEKAGLFDKGQMGQSLSAMANRGELGLPAPANPSTDGSRQGLWVTPRTSGTSTRPNKTTPRQGLTLIEQAREQAQWGTPTARDHKSGRGNEEREYKELTPMVERTQTGKLNPRWVETLMGLPVGWTMPSCKSPVTIALKNFACSETESSQPQPSELFAF